jgi:thiol-disulfide isomerase/thioredoxin
VHAPEAESLLRAVLSEHPNRYDRAQACHMLAIYWYDKRPLGVIADGELFALRHLSVGKAPPDISGHDHEGKPLALSNYRGNVVVVTFSGNWCGPCVGMYPQERELVAKMKDKSFALLSVNTDANVETLKKSIAAGDIT